MDAVDGKQDLGSKRNIYSGAGSPNPFQGDSKRACCRVFTEGLSRLYVSSVDCSSYRSDGNVVHGSSCESN